MKKACSMLIVFWVLCKVIIQPNLLDPIGAQCCGVTEWLRKIHSVLSVLVSTFNLGLNAAKNTPYIKKKLRLKVIRN